MDPIGFHNQPKATRWSHLRSELDGRAFPEPPPERGADPYALDPSSMKKEPMLKFIRHWLKEQGAGVMPVRPRLRKATAGSPRKIGSHKKAGRKTKAQSEESDSASEEEPPAQETSDDNDGEEDEVDMAIARPEYATPASLSLACSDSARARSRSKAAK